MKIFRHILISTLAMVTMFSCLKSEQNLPKDESDSNLINISGSIGDEGVTKADEKGFQHEDVVGVYIVDFEKGQPGILQNKGNRADNLRFTYNKEKNKWTPAYKVYWKDKHTKVDIYGYYPYGEPTDVNKYAFEVEYDQRKKAEHNKLGGYEASDFLWGKSLANSPTDKTIILGFRHMLSCVQITLMEGLGFAPGEWEEAKKEVVIMNTIRKSEIDLTTGSATADASAEMSNVIPYKNGTEYRGIVIPQSVKSGTEIMSVTVNGRSYFLKKTEDITYIPSKQHNFTMTVNKRQEDGGLECVLSSESITAWENDIISHEATASEYTVIYVEKEGTLEDCIRSAKKDPAKIKNLKLNGHIDKWDFNFMRERMESLTSLNLKDVIIKDLKIPSLAFSGKESLKSIVLPDKLKEIGDNAFNSCSNLSGSLIIPEGVTKIEDAAFMTCTSFSGSLYLPNTLKTIGSLAFLGCQFSNRLELPENLEYIGDQAFASCSQFSGELRLPDKLKFIGLSAFSYCTNLKGSLKIPQGITEIPPYCFLETEFGGTLTLHDGITSIGNEAFSNAKLCGELILPKNLENLGSAAFCDNNFTGNLIIPRNVISIPNRTFDYSHQRCHSLEIPENIISIGEKAYCDWTTLEEVIIHSNTETILANAFFGCENIKRIVCKGMIPPNLNETSFAGVPVDQVTVEVPESSVMQYKASPGWKNFRTIIAYRDFSVYPKKVTSLNSQTTRQLKLTSDREWVVESMPEWIQLDRTSGKGNDELKLTITQKPAGSPKREGQIVLRLKGEQFTTVCQIEQFDYDRKEDEFITLQKATKGTGINIVLLGDGFDAKEISEGLLDQTLENAYKHFFEVEPYNTYKDYFNVMYAISLSKESGICNVNTKVDNRFSTGIYEGTKLGCTEKGFDTVIDYACLAPGVTKDNLYKTLVVIVPNTVGYESASYLWDNGFAISYCPIENSSIDHHFNHIIQHEACGHGFGKFCDEAVCHNSFIDECTCQCCQHTSHIRAAKAKGWYENISLSGMMSKVPWTHLLKLEKYKSVVDIFEGGFMHSKGVFRSERVSCMGSDIAYFSSICRESIVRRIKAYAGEQFDFKDFVAKDVMSIPYPKTTAMYDCYKPSNRASTSHIEPTFMGRLESDEL